MVRSPCSRSANEYYPDHRQQPHRSELDRRAAATFWTSIDWKGQLVGHVSSAFKLPPDLDHWPMSQNYIHLYIVTWMLSGAARSTLNAMAWRREDHKKEDVRSAIRATDYRRWPAIGELAA